MFIECFRTMLTPWFLPPIQVNDYNTPDAVIHESLLTTQEQKSVNNLRNEKLNENSFRTPYQESWGASYRDRPQLGTYNRPTESYYTGCEMFNNPNNYSNSLIDKVEEKNINNKFLEFENQIDSFDNKFNK